ncbi:hypothetical protein [Sphingomonas sp.]|jgi:hypothetical protein|uniref:hypothetical protein n=1 Tax=Sphingomonas sp. TaxID=28214 RepID=UPI003569D7D5
MATATPLKPTIKPVVGQAYKPSTQNGTTNIAQTGLGAQETLAAPESVEARTQGILTDTNSSGLMQKAKAEGLATANRRGLINSSIAAGASQKAMYDVAVPIAAADAGASNAFSRADQDFGFNQNLQTQAEQATATLQTNLQSAQLAAQSAMQKAQFGQELTLQEKDLISKVKLAETAFNQNKQLLSQEYGLRGTLQDQDLAGRTKLQELAGTQSMQQQQAGQTFTREQNEFNTRNQVFLQNAQNQFAAVLQRSAGASQIFQSASDELQAIVSNPNFDKPTREKLIAEVNTNMNLRLGLQRDLLGFGTQQPNDPNYVNTKKPTKVPPGQTQAGAITPEQQAAIDRIRGVVGARL